MQAFADTLLALASYPVATPDYAIDQAVELAARMGAKISALMLAIDPERAARVYWHHRPLFDLPEEFQQSVQKSEYEAQRLLARFEERALARGIYGDCILMHAPVIPAPELVTHLARVRDLTFVPVPDLIGLEEVYIESVVFNSGRPSMLLSASASSPARPVGLETIALAWDFSRPAARALADAMPLLACAKSVRVVTVLNEKEFEGGAERAGIERHLKAHGIAAAFDEVQANGRQIGSVLQDYVTDCRADMLVMGAFGHSRMTEFVLGGATRSILRNPPVPVFVSH